MSVNKSSVHSISKQYQDVTCETSLRYHLKKLNMEELIKLNEMILLQELIKKTLNQVRVMNLPLISLMILITEK
jgi:hypothetical protein